MTIVWKFISYEKTAIYQQEQLHFYRNVRLKLNYAIVRFINNYLELSLHENQQVELKSFSGGCTAVQATQSWREDTRWVLWEGTWGKEGRFYDVNFNLIKA